MTELPVLIEDFQSQIDSFRTEATKHGRTNNREPYLWGPQSYYQTLENSPEAKVIIGSDFKIPNSDLYEVPLMLKSWPPKRFEGFGEIALLDFDLMLDNKGNLRAINKMVALLANEEVDPDCIFKARYHFGTDRHIARLDWISRIATDRPKVSFKYARNSAEELRLPFLYDLDTVQVVNGLVKAKLPLFVKPYPPKPQRRESFFD